MSAALLLRLLPEMRLADTAPVALESLLRAAFGPPPGWRGWWRDPVRAIHQLPPTLFAQVVDRILAVPGHEIDASLDPEAALIAAHRKLAHPTTAHRGPSLALAALTCEARLGAAWYFAPVSSTSLISRSSMMTSAAAGMPPNPNRVAISPEFMTPVAKVGSSTCCTTSML